MNARYRAEPVPLAPNLPADGASGLPAPQTKPHGVAANPTRAEQNTEPSPRSRKSASVTVRLTAAEDSQFRARAAEAGLTVSAYLRSCAFEIEDLRAQVKQALVHMREIEQQSPAPSPGWLSRLLRRVPRSG